MVENPPYLIDNHINSPDIYVGVGDTLYQYRALAHFDFGFRNADFGFINLIIKNIHNNIEFGRRDVACNVSTAFGGYSYPRPKETWQFI